MIKIELTKKQASTLYSLLMIVDREVFLSEEEKYLRSKIQDTIFKQIINS